MFYIKELLLSIYSAYIRIMSILRELSTRKTPEKPILFYERSCFLWQKKQSEEWTQGSSKEEKHTVLRYTWAMNGTESKSAKQQPSPRPME
jgi:hypothetical protein